MGEADNKLPAERQRMEESWRRTRNWQRWGPYLAERQWGTVREDYSADGNPWAYFTHDHARSRAYRWGEDGLLGITDRECRLCFALALWNGRDPILKERLYGLTPGEGNHGEDVKECYFYLDATPTHSYMKALYKYPQREYPYQHLVDTNRRRNAFDGEYELLDTGVFEGNRYFDVLAEYAKAGPDDILIRLSVTNHGPEPAELDLLASLWFRNTWTPASPYEDWGLPVISQAAAGELLAEHSNLGVFRLLAGPGPGGGGPEWLFTDNHTNNQRLFGTPNCGPFVKDAFHEYLVHGRKDAVRTDGRGTKAAGRYHLAMEPGQTVELRLRLTEAGPVPADPLGPDFQAVFDQRIAEAGEFYDQVIPCDLPEPVRDLARQAYAGLLWTKQFYCYVVKDWLDGDPGLPPPPRERKDGRNHNWRSLFNRNILSMPDKWEFPWYAAWDSAFQMLPMAGVDPEFAKDQLVLLLREWFMHPSGQLPAYEFASSDVNPPVHAWACWRVYKIAAKRLPAGHGTTTSAAAGQGGRDRLFLERTFQKLLLNFTWWVNRKDVHGRHVFAGGFLGMDNIGPFDRNEAAAGGAGGSEMEQADGTAWMAFYCLTMLEMALELAKDDPAYEDTASKFFMHFTAISDAMNSLGGTGLWDEQDGFYYDMICSQDRCQHLRVRSLVGLIPLIAVVVLEDRELERYEGFRQRMDWFLQYRKDLAGQVSFMDCRGCGLKLLAIPSRERLERVLARMLDEKEFLSPYGIRSLSRVYQDDPHVFEVGGQKYCIGYEPGESMTNLFGGNSNWRGPVWMPINYLLIEALERYHHFYGDTLQVECPTGSGRRMNLKQVSQEIRRRVCRIFLPDEQGRRPWWGEATIFRDDPAWRDLALFHEYYHGDSGKGLGASHQTGWTALIVRLLEDMVANGG